MLRPENSSEFFGARIGANANGTANSLFAAGKKQDNIVRRYWHIGSATFSWNFHNFLPKVDIRSLGRRSVPSLPIDPLSFAKAFARIRFILRTANARRRRALRIDAPAGSFRCIDHGFYLAAVRQAAATCALNARTKSVPLPSEVSPHSLLCRVHQKTISFNL